MASVRICFSSDWHHDASTDGVARAADVEQAIHESVQYAVAQRVDAYMMLGDLSDPDNVRSHRAAAFALSVAVQLNTAGIPNYWLVGNHDVIEDGGAGSTLIALRYLGGLTTLLDRPGVFSVCGANALALPFAPRSQAYKPEDAVNAAPTDTRLVIGHLNAEGIERGSESEHMPRGRDVFWPMAALRKRLLGAKYVGGHYHRAQTFGGDLHIVGSPVRLTHGEEDMDPSILTMEI